MAVVNAWFVYKRDCKELAASKPMPLRKFQASVAAALCNSGKPARGKTFLRVSKKEEKTI
ncbi:hypothetical protein HOLleu_03889 [Holothuria leucospilota]|uniref:Uncharacterized protein n=1 Tax=Holothuria leucospilota TaxID=206669 RepID=A0A9Q1CTY5_HOLLE|nr:hypothetical protein HOLleu_03889 [Holothuria leucospilota]